jgi:hypothetical protein
VVAWDSLPMYQLDAKITLRTTAIYPLLYICRRDYIPALLIHFVTRWAPLSALLTHYITSIILDLMVVSDQVHSGWDAIRDYDPWTKFCGRYGSAQRLFW